MKECPNCHNQTDDLTPYCPVCGTALDAIGHIKSSQFYSKPQSQIPVPEQPQRQPNLNDYTSSFTCQDIADNRLLCMIVYLLDAVGVIIALLMSPTSEFTRFHIRQSLKFTVLETLVLLACALLCWTLIVPIIGAVALLVLLAAKISCFIDVCCGKATESVIIRSFKFLN